MEVENDLLLDRGSSTILYKEDRYDILLDTGRKATRDQEERQKKLDDDKKKPKFVVGTGATLDSKAGECPGQAEQQ